MFISKTQLSTIMALCCLGLGAFAAHPPIADLTSDTSEALFETVNSTVQKQATDNGPVLAWTVNTGQTANLGIRKDHPLFARLRYYDRLDFEFRIRGEINTVGFEALGHVSGARQYKVHQWEVALRTTPKDQWHRRQLNLSRPNWFPWDSPDGHGPDGFFAFNALALVPGTTIEFRNIRLVRGILNLKPDFQLPATWPIAKQNEDGSITYVTRYQLLNSAGQPLKISAEVRSAHTQFKVGFEEEEVDVKNGKVAKFTLRATIAKSAIAQLPELYEEALEVAFVPSSLPNAAALWHGYLVRPLSATLNRQAVIPKGDLQRIRDAVKSQDAALLGALKYQQVLKTADDFLSKRLDALPGGRGHVRNNWPHGPNKVGELRPGRFMPEVVDKNGKFREVGTALAGAVWKEYLGHVGKACERLGQAYLYTGDEKYAQKAIELFELYASQFRELHWYSLFDPPWDRGPAILASSRLASGSTYGSNWYMKGLCRLASMIADSPSWTDAKRKRVYGQFVVPYAQEIMKFPGGISNMTDITNHNVLLLGLAFNDAHMVRWSLRTDPGILSRLGDIDSDGFSSEGRPTNYHIAAMAEFLPSIGYLARAGLDIEIPKAKLLAALRMPYERAALDGRIPNSGDCGRGYVAARNRLAEHLIPICPDEEWLYDIGASKLRLLLAGKTAKPKGWQRLYSKKPRLFREAGLAVLRSGDTPETQIQMTLDYGRNLFHAAYDRNQITLSAFGKIFSHGPGSLYNVGRGGMIRGKDKKLNSFCSHGSLGHNVILVDAKDQQAAVGNLLAWHADPSHQVAVSEVAGIQPGVVHTRGIVLTHGIAVILDRIVGNAEHQYDFAYHNLGQLSLGNGWKQTPRAEPLAKRANYENIVNLHALNGSGLVALTWDLTEQITARQRQALEKAEKQPAPAYLHFHQLTGPESQLYTGATGMNNSNTTEMPASAPSLFHRVKGKEAVFVTILEPSKQATSSVKTVKAHGSDGVMVTLAGGQSLTLGLDALIREHANGAK